MNVTVLREKSTNKEISYRNSTILNMPLTFPLAYSFRRDVIEFEFAPNSDPDEVRRALCAGYHDAEFSSPLEGADMKQPAALLMDIGPFGQQKWALICCTPSKGHTAAKCAVVEAVARAIRASDSVKYPVPRAVVVEAS